MTRVTEIPARLASKGVGRAIALAAVAAATAALGACSAGQISETAYMVTAVPGVNQRFYVNAPDGTTVGSVSIRDMVVAFDAHGYKAGGDAPLQLSIFNDTETELKVTIGVDPAAAASVTLGSGAPAGHTEESPAAAPSGSASAEPAASPTAATPAGGPAVITIPSGRFATLSSEAGRQLMVHGLKEELGPGGVLDGVTFDFQFGSGLTMIASPAAPQPESTDKPSESCVFTGAAAVCRVPMTNPLSAPPRASAGGGGGHE